MKYIVAISLLLLLVVGAIFAQTGWEGNAMTGTRAEFASPGLFAVTNAFASGTRVHVVNLDNGRMLEVRVLGRVGRPGIFMVLSPEASTQLGVDPTAPARVLVRPLVAIGDQSLFEQPFHPDPDLNPSLAAPNRGLVEPEEPRTPIATGQIEPPFAAPIVPPSIPAPAPTERPQRAQAPVPPKPPVQQFAPQPSVSALPVPIAPRPLPPTERPPTITSPPARTPAASGIGLRQAVGDVSDRLQGQELFATDVPTGDEPLQPALAGEPQPTNSIEQGLENIRGRLPGNALTQQQPRPTDRSQQAEPVRQGSISEGFDDTRRRLPEGLPASRVLGDFVDEPSVEQSIADILPEPSASIAELPTDEVVDSTRDTYLPPARVPRAPLASARLQLPNIADSTKLPTESVIEEPEPVEEQPPQPEIVSRIAPLPEVSPEPPTPSPSEIETDPLLATAPDFSPFEQKSAPVLTPNLQGIEPEIRRPTADLDGTIQPDEPYLPQLIEARPQLTQRIPLGLDTPTLPTSTPEPETRTRRLGIREPEITAERQLALADDSDTLRFVEPTATEGEGLTFELEPAAERPPESEPELPIEPETPEIPEIQPTTPAESEAEAEEGAESDAEPAAVAEPPRQSVPQPVPVPPPPVRPIPSVQPRTGAPTVLDPSEERRRVADETGRRLPFIEPIPGIRQPDFVLDTSNERRIAAQETPGLPFVGPNPDSPTIGREPSNERQSTGQDGTDVPFVGPVPGGRSAFTLESAGERPPQPSDDPNNQPGNQTEQIEGVEQSQPQINPSTQVRPPQLSVRPPIPEPLSSERPRSTPGSPRTGDPSAERRSTTEDQRLPFVEPTISDRARGGDFLLEPSEERPPRPTPGLPSTPSTTDRVRRSTPPPIEQEVIELQEEPLIGEQYYLQVGVYSSEQAARSVAAALRVSNPSYPITVRKADLQPIFRVLIGPIGDDERGAALFWIRARGYPSAYARRGTEL